MPFFGNRRRDFSIQPPRQQVDGTPFFVTDSANIDFTLNNLNLTADLTFTGVTAGIYGDATNIPVLQIDQWGRVTGVTTIPIGGGGGTYTVNNGLTENPANNFKLGGTLIQNTTIAETIYNLLFSSENKNSLFLFPKYTSANTTEEALRIFRGVIGPPGNNGADNIGASITFKTEAKPGFVNAPLVNDLILASVATNADPQLSRDTQFELWTNYQNNLTQNIIASRNYTLLQSRIVELSASNGLIFTGYGSGSFLNTPTYALGVDASGNVVEFTTSPTTGDSISPFLLMGG